MNHIEKDLTQKRIEMANWIFLAVLFIPSLIFAPLKFALGVLFGGFICIINFHWLGRSLKGAFQNMGESGNIRTRWCLFTLKFLCKSATEMMGMVVRIIVVIVCHHQRAADSLCSSIRFDAGMDGAGGQAGCVEYSHWVSILLR